MKELKISEAYGVGWEGMKNNWLGYLLLALIYVIGAAVQAALKGMVGDMPLAWLFSFLLSILVQMILVMAIYQYGLKIAAEGGAQVSLKDLDLSPSTALNYILTQLLMMVILFGVMAIVAVGAALAAGVNLSLDTFNDKANFAPLMEAMAIPLLAAGLIMAVFVIYFALTYSFSLLAVLHQGLGPLEALAESKRLSEGVHGGIFIFLLSLIGVTLLGLICFLIGVIPAVITAYIAFPAAYLSLLDQSGPRV
jgi:hypothetical protein